MSPPFVFSLKHFGFTCGCDVRSSKAILLRGLLGCSCLLCPPGGRGARPWFLVGTRSAPAPLLSTSEACTVLGKWFNTFPSQHGFTVFTCH